MPSGWKKNYQRYRKVFLNVYQVYNQKPDTKAFLELLLTISILIFFGLFALRPTILTIVDLFNQIEQKREVNTKLETKIQNLTIAQRIVDEQFENIILLETAIPDSALPDGFVRQIEGLSQTNSTQILGISTSDVLLSGIEEKQKRSSKELKPLPEGAKELPFTISITGNYESLKSFLSGIEQMRRPPKIDNVTINTSETESGRVLILIVSGRLPYIE